jgi:predicted phage terminase large subunit-like protein
MEDEWIRRQVLENNRVDILAVAVLGLLVEPFHLALLQFQFAHPDNLQLVFRGAGKSTMCTVTKSIHMLLINPNLRILIASKTAQNAEGFLKEIKNHFEGNERLAEIFGPMYDQRRCNKWDSREIEVLPRSSPHKEASITCVGVDGTIVSKHYDVIIGDDLVDEENSRTQYMRDKTKTWYYNTLDPTLEPPDPTVRFRGEYHRLGTRYHYDDLWGHLQANELAEHNQVIPALDESQRSPWPTKFHPDWFAQKRKKSGLIIFNAQYQCDTEAMKGEIFRYDDCQQISPGDYPELSSMRVFMGVDLAIGEKESADMFAIVVVGIMPDKSGYYVLDYFEGHLRFAAQTKKIVEFYRRWDPIRALIETNQYQDSQYQNVKDKHPDVRVKPFQQVKDKVTRAMKLSALFEDKRVFFKKGAHNLLVEHLVLFPSHRYKDLFDALDLAIRAGRVRKRRTRPQEPGVI